MLNQELNIPVPEAFTTEMLEQVRGEGFNSTLRIKAGDMDLFMRSCVINMYLLFHSHEEKECTEEKGNGKRIIEVTGKMTAVL